MSTPTPTLSPDFFPRRRLRHWLQARGSGYIAWWLCQLEARDRRYHSMRLSGHGSPSVDSQEDRGGSRRVQIEPKLKLVKGRRTA